MDIFWTTILTQNKSITRCLLFYNLSENTWLNNWVSARKKQKEKKINWGNSQREPIFVRIHLVSIYNHGRLLLILCVCACVFVCVCTFFHLSGQTHNLENITKLVRTLWFLFWRYEIKTDFLLIVHFFPSFWSNTQPRQRNKISQNPLISLLVVWD